MLGGGGWPGGAAGWQDGRLLAQGVQRGLRGRGQSPNGEPHTLSTPAPHVPYAAHAHMNAHTHAHACKHTRTHTCAHTCMNTYTDAHAHTPLGLRAINETWEGGRGPGAHRDLEEETGPCPEGRPSSPSTGKETWKNCQIQSRKTTWKKWWTDLSFGTKSTSGHKTASKMPIPGGQHQPRSRDGMPWDLSPAPP